MKRGETSERNDDNLESIKKKRETYEKETIPVIEKFKRDAGFVIEINGDKELDEVYSEIKSHLNKLGYEEK
jgi:adenylate kinase family enzyme